MTDKNKNRYEELRENAEGKARNRKAYTSSRGNLVVPRRYHMLDAKATALKEMWETDVSAVPVEIRERVSSTFFNPFRRAGSYYGAVQALFILGANEWFSFVQFRPKMQEVMSSIVDNKTGKSAWEKFQNRKPREGAKDTRGVKGRIMQNMTVIQRLSGRHPYGEKLKQLCACVDVRRSEDGMLWYRLNTMFDSPSNVVPIKENKGPRKPRVVRGTKACVEVAKTMVKENQPSESEILSSAPEETV